LSVALSRTETAVQEAAVCQACAAADVVNWSAPVGAMVVGAVLFNDTNVTPLASASSSATKSVTARWTLHRLDCGLQVADTSVGASAEVPCSVEQTETKFLLISGSVLLAVLSVAVARFHRRHLSSLISRWARPLTTMELKVDVPTAPPPALMLSDAPAPQDPHPQDNDLMFAPSALRCTALGDEAAPASAPCVLSPPTVVRAGGARMQPPASEETASVVGIVQSVGSATPSEWSLYPGMGSLEVGWPEDPEAAKNQLAWAAPPPAPRGARPRPPPLGLGFPKGGLTTTAAAWPWRLARVWALRSIFVLVASVAVCLRLLHIVLCGLFPENSRDDDGIVLLFIAAQWLLCVAPLGWCSAYSRRPKQTMDALGKIESVLESASQAVLFCKVPRFVCFALAVGAIEAYSIVSTTLLFARSACDMPAWRTILLCVVGVPAAVARCYSAILALRLQREFGKAADQVLPNAIQVTPVSDSDVGFDFNVALGVPRTPPVSPSKAVCDGGDSGQLRNLSTAKPSSSRGRGSLLSCSCCRRRSRHYALSDDEHHGVLRIVEGSSSPRSSEGSGRERSATVTASVKRSCQAPSPICVAAMRCGCLFAFFLIGGIVLVLIFVPSAPLDQFVPSACVTAQNATATCEDFEAVGDSILGLSGTDLTDIRTMQDCCSGCDSFAGCQAWMFDHLGSRCRWLRFLEQPCSSNPGDQRCTCFTHQGTTFGFRPSGRIMWQRSP